MEWKNTHNRIFDYPFLSKFKVPFDEYYKKHLTNEIIDNNFIVQIWLFGYVRDFLNFENDTHAIDTSTLNSYLSIENIQYMHSVGVIPISDFFYFDGIAYSIFISCSEIYNERNYLE